MTQQTSVNSSIGFRVCSNTNSSFFRACCQTFAWVGGGGAGCKKDIQADSIISLCMIV